MSKNTIKNTIVKFGSLRAAWPSLRKMNLPDMVLDAIGEIVAADSETMSRRSKVKSRENTDPELYAEIDKLVNRGITLAGLEKALRAKWPEMDAKGKSLRVPSRATIHRLMMQTRPPAERQKKS